MTGWVILVDQPRDLPNAETPHKVITTSEYLARPRLFEDGEVDCASVVVMQPCGLGAPITSETIVSAGEMRSPAIGRYRFQGKYEGRE